MKKTILKLYDPTSTPDYLKTYISENKTYITATDIDGGSIFMTKALLVKAKSPEDISTLGIFLTSSGTVPEKNSYTAPTDILKKNTLNYLTTEIGGN
jgi:hypothetical protein